MTELLGELLAGMCEAAFQDALVATIRYEGPPARVLIFDPETKVLFGVCASEGDELRVLRSHRMLIEPIDHVRLRSLIAMTDWRTM